MDDSDSLTRSRPRSATERIRRQFDFPGQTLEGVATEPKLEPEVLEAGFGPEDFDPNATSYTAFGTANRTVPSLCLILKDGSQRAISYAHLDSHHPAGCEFIPSSKQGNMIRLRVAGHSVVFFVVIAGRNLQRGWERVMKHQVTRIWEYPSDIDSLANDEPVVKSIRFELEQA